MQLLATISTLVRLLQPIGTFFLAIQVDLELSSSINSGTAVAASRYDNYAQLDTPNPTSRVEIPYGRVETTFVHLQQTRKFAAVARI